MAIEYDTTIHVRGNELRVILDDGLVKAFHNGSEVASRRGDLGLLIFQVTEQGEQVMYDIAVLHSSCVRIFVGRNGILIYSDDPAIRPNRSASETSSS